MLRTTASVHKFMLHPLYLNIFNCVMSVSDKDISYREGLPKEEAEALKAKLSEVGGDVILE